MSTHQHSANGSPESGNEQRDGHHDEIAHVTQHLLEDLVTTTPPKNREVEAAKARARSANRFATA